MTHSLGSDGNGLTLAELFRARPGVSLTFDDLIILPRFVEEPPGRVDLKTPLAPGLLMNPLVSSPMDTVTEWETAVHMALMGCLGVLHVNLTPEEAAEQVRKVKRFQMGFIFDPLCRRPDHSVADARQVKEEHGFSTIVVTEDGTARSRFLGLVTRSCVDLEEDGRKPLGEAMLSSESLRRFGWLKTTEEITDLDAALGAFRKDPRLTKLPIVTTDGRIHALVNRNNLAKNARYPDMLADENRQLRVFAAVSTHPEDDERVRLLLDAGADGFVIDSSQGGTGHAVRRLRQIAALAPEVPIVAGNIVTPNQAMELVHEACAFRVGMGSGSICITQGQYGLGRAQGSAIRHSSGPVLIADGGIRDPGDMIKALALGASFVMLGRYLAGCDETPSETVYHKGRRYKLYRGMGSPGAMRARGAVRYGGRRGYNPREIVAQGVEGLVPASGPLVERLAEALAAIRGALSQLGCASLRELHDEVRAGRIRFELRSEAARREGAVHDLEPLPTSE